MATKGDKGLFIDTNVLVYANVIETPLHKQAWAAINAAHEAGRAIWISRQVIREYLVTPDPTADFYDTAQGDGA